MAKQSKESSNAIAERIKEWQSGVIWLLYGALLLKALAVFLPRLDFPSGVLLFVFFLLEIFLLSPLGMGLMCIMVSVLFFLLPNIVQLLVGLAIGSMLILVLGVAVSAALSCIILTFLDGILMSVEVISITSPMAIAMGIYGTSIGLGAGTGYVVKTAISTASGKAVAQAKRKILQRLLGSLLVFVMIGWPSLSYSQAISGTLACKPAVILNQAHLNYLNYNDAEGRRNYQELFDDEEKWVFRNGFYSDHINNGRNNITQGGKDMAAGDENTFALLLNGLLYVQNPYITHLDYSYGYQPRETDALVLVDGTTFIFGHDRVFCAGASGRYTWKKTKWTSQFEKLSPEEQFEQVYDILERQNTTQDVSFSYEEAGVVAYAQRNGLLLNYDAKTHCAWFARKEKDKSITVFLQDGPDHREEVVSFTPDCPENRVPYFMYKTEGILYIKGHQVKFLDAGQGWIEVNHFTNPEYDGKLHNVVAINYMDLGDAGKYITYLDDKDKIGVDTALIGTPGVTMYDFDSCRNKVTASTGDYIYSIQYDDNLLSRLTYIPDMLSARGTDQHGWGISEIWEESWSYKRIELKKSLFIPEEDMISEASEETEPEGTEPEETEPEETEPEEIDLEEQYPAPVVSRRRSGTPPYDKTYIVASNYASYSGPRDWFYFSYPEKLYSQVDYTIENDGDDIDILFTGDGGSGYLEVSLHPLPEDAGDIKAYAESLCSHVSDDMYNGHVDHFDVIEAGEDYRFRVSGWSEMGSGERCCVNCRVSKDYVMLMRLKCPKGTDDEDKAVKEFYKDRITYGCGFRPPAKNPDWHKYK